MAFVLKTVKQILDEMLDHLLAEGVITDVNRGSVARTLMEAAAMQDADQYIQIANIRDAFSIDAASGDALDRRALDFGLTRLQPTKSLGVNALSIKETLLPSDAVSTLALAVTAGVSVVLQVQVANYADYPDAGNVVIDRGTPALREVIAYTSKTAPDLLNLAAPVLYSHDIGASVHLSGSGIDQPLPAGTQVYVPATVTTEQLTFVTTESKTLYDGDEGVIVGVQSTGTGSVQNVSSGSIAQFTSKPWATAALEQTQACSDGRDLETDAEFRSRIKLYVQALPKSTAISLIGAALDVTDATTGQRVTSAQVVEPIVAGDPALLYIDDGMGTIETTQGNDTEVVSATGDSLWGFTIISMRAEANEVRFNLGVWPLVLDSERIYRSVGSGTVSNYNPGTRVFTVSGTYADNSLVGKFLMDDGGRMFRITANAEIAKTITVAVLEVGQPDPTTDRYTIIAIPYDANLTPNPLQADIDYVINETTGDIELLVPLAAGDSLVLAGVNGGPAYVRYTGLIHEVQRIINGDPTDFENYPGVKAAGVKVIVLAPSVTLHDFVLNVVAVTGVDESTLYTAAKQLTEQYVNGLGIGDNIILARIIEAVMSISGILDVRILQPVANVTIPAGTLARTSLARITVT